MTSSPKGPAVARVKKAGARLKDARSLRSQGLLRSALLRLIERQQFGDISVRDITSEAGVSYPTFFNHYESREDLFQDLARSEIIGLLDAFRVGNELPDWRPGRGMSDYVFERRALWRTLLASGASEVMRSAFIRRGREIAGDRKLGHGVPIDLVSAIISSGTFEIIDWWLSQDEKIPAATIADMLETIVIEPALNLSRGHFADRG